MTSAFKIIYILASLMLQKAALADQEIDLTGPGCDRGYYITSPDEIINVVSIPNYNAMATRDTCDVTITAEVGRRIEYLISRLKFDECGIEIRIFDSDTAVTPRDIINCESRAPIQEMTRYNVMKIRLRKTTSQSRHYEFLMQLKNDLGPPFSYLEDEAGYQGESLQTGVIVGLVIAGIIIIVALILLAIYLCVRARQANLKAEAATRSDHDASIYTSGTSQAIFPSHGQPLSKRKGYGSFEDVRSTTSSQNTANGAYTNPAYTKGPNEKRSERSSSLGRARGKAGFANQAFDDEDGYRREGYWEEGEETRGSLRKSRRDAYDMPASSPQYPRKSAMKKPTEIEMSKVNTQPVSILKTKTRTRSPNRSTAGSSTDGSTVDTNAIIRGYKDSGIDHPNVKKSLGLQPRRARSRSGGRSNSSVGSHRGQRSRSADKKQPPKDTGRMYTGAFIDDGNKRRSSGRRPRSGSTGRSSRARSDRTSDSLDSESTSTTTSKRISFNPGGRRVHIKGEETDI